MKIRPINDKDRQAVLEVIHSTGMFTKEEEQVATEMIDLYLNEPDQRDYIIEVIAKGQDAIAGYMCYGSRPMAEGVVDLYWLAIHPGKHRQGYGKALLQWLEKDVQAKKARLILIETSSKDKYAPTRHFYQCMGYVENARIRDFYRLGDDLLIYSKYLKTEGA